MEELPKLQNIDKCSKENFSSHITVDVPKNEHENITKESILSDEDKFKKIVFVGNLGDETSKEEVIKLFIKEIGLLECEILDVNMLWRVKRDSKTLAFTFVEFSCDEAYQKALTLNSSFHFGHNLLVLPSVMTHCGLFIMGENERKKNEIECTTDKLDDKKDEMESKKDKLDDKKDEMESKKDKLDDKKDEMESKKDNFESKKNEIDCNNAVIAVESPIAPEKKIVPTYKKSDYVAYLKNLPPDVSEDNILKFLNFTRNDIVDIYILKRNRKKAFSNNHGALKAIIAFSSEENLKKCLSQNCRVFQNHCIEIEKHRKSKTASTGEEQSANSSESNDSEMLTELLKQQECSSKSEKDMKNTDKMEMDLFVKHINWLLIELIFSSVGAKIMGTNQIGSVRNRSRGMGFVTVADKESLLKGLALDGAILLGKKMSVSIRNDRKFLECPIVGEIPQSYSTFVGNLPVKNSAETLKLALMDYFKEIGCLVESVHVPLAGNHSGNRGYAFVIFKDENSLTKASKLNDTEIEICSSKVKVSVSKHWPELPKEEIDAAPKPRAVYRRPKYDSSKSGKSLGRKREATSPQRGYRNFPKKLATQREYPLKQSQKQVGGYDAYDTEYDARRNYPEFRDYVALRKEYDDRQKHAEYRARRDAEHKEEFFPKESDGQTPFLPTAQSSFVTNSGKAFHELVPESKEKYLENEWNNYSLAVSSMGGNVEFNQCQQTPVTASSALGKHAFNPMSSTPQGYDNFPQSISASHGDYEKGLPSVYPGSSTIPRSKNDVHNLVSYPVGNDGKVVPSSVWSLSADRYSSREKTSLQRDPQWCASNDKNSRERRDVKSPLQAAVFGNDSSNREPKFPGFRSSYAAERGRDMHPVFNRSTPMDSVGITPSSSVPYPAEDASWVSYPARTSAIPRSNELYTYADHPRAERWREKKYML